MSPCQRERLPCRLSRRMRKVASEPECSTERAVQYDSLRHIAR